MRREHHLRRAVPRSLALSSLAAAFCAALVAGCGGSGLAGQAGRSAIATTGQPVPGGPVPASAIGRLTALAVSLDRSDGGVPVASVTAVVTTRELALTSATPGDLIPGSQNTVVYLLTMKASRAPFVDIGFSGPSGSKAPTGRYVSLVVDAKTFEGLDYGISPRAPPVAPAALGPVTHLAIGTKGTG